MNSCRKLIVDLRSLHCIAAPMCRLEVIPVLRRSLGGGVSKKFPLADWTNLIDHE